MTISAPLTHHHRTRHQIFLQIRPQGNPHLSVQAFVLASSGYFSYYDHFLSSVGHNGPGFVSTQNSYLFFKFSISSA